MRIRTQFIITLLFFGIILAIIAASAAITNQRSEKAREQRKIASGIAQGVSDLSYLANDYLIYREDQQLSRWNSKFDAISAEVASFDVEVAEQQNIVNNILANQARMKEVFDSIVTASTGFSTNPAAAFDPALMQVSWSRLAVQSQNLISDASLLSQLLEDEADRQGQINTIVIFSMIAVFGAFLLINFLLIQRRMLRSISELQAGTGIVGSGNLDYIIKEEKNDEIGDLSRAFNSMTVNLKDVTASKADLEREIGERERAERELQSALKDLERSNLELEQFAYVASHDLNEPLRMVSSYLKLLERRYAGKLDTDALDFINIAVDGAKRMRIMIEDLLAYSRVGTRGGEFTEVDAGQALADALNNLQISIRESGARITHGDLPNIAADPSQLTQLFQNLLGNAIKFRGEKPPRIDIQAEKNNGEWLFSVSDNGIGIELQYSERIFDIFQRLHNREDYPGTGIGLAICKRIIERHGGRIWMDSEPGKGTTISFTIPAQTGD